MGLVEQADEILSHATVWVINPQKAAETARFKEKRGAPFVFLADEDLRVVHLYGIYHMVHPEHGHIPYPVTFIVKPNGTIAWRYLGLKPRDRPKVEDVLNALKAINAK